MKFKDRYKRLCSGWHVFYRYTLWSGGDHLLHIATGIFIEDYKRFYYRDIQAFIIHKTNSWLVWSIVLTVLATLSALLTYALDDIQRLGPGIITILLVMIAFISFIRGPGCVCYIQTAVQKHNLRSISRIRKAQKILDTLKPVILESQQES